MLKDYDIISTKNASWKFSEKLIALIAIATQLVCAPKHLDSKLKKLF